jgi:hypothetical protein
MILSLLYLVSALSISAIAAYFSVLGLATIFPGSMGPIIIMGGVLEAGKIVAAIWLHRNWKTSPLLIKSYLTFAVLVLMGITSMGIFGFLSRAHIEHQTTTDKALAMVETINNKIKREQDYIERQKQYINSLESRTDKSASSTRIDIDQENERIKDITEQMNKDILFEQGRIDKLSEELSELNKELEKEESGQGGLFSNKKKKIEELKARQAPVRERIGAEIRSYNESIDVFREQAKKDTQSIIDKISNFRNKTNEKDTTIQPQIDEHSKNIAESHGKIDDLEIEKMGLSDNARSLEAEVGPVKYVAEGIADITGKEFRVDQAVRVVIVILVLVFDPLAILLVIAANISISKNFPASNKSRKIEKQSKKLEEAKLALEEEEGRLKKSIENLKKDKEAAESSIASAKKESEGVEKSLNEKQNEELKLEELASAALNELEEEVLRREQKLKKIEEKIKEKTKLHAEEEIKLKNIKLNIKSETEKEQKAAEEARGHKRAIQQDEQDLFKKEAELSAAKATVNAQAAKVESEQEKYNAKIKNLEEILAHLAKEKEKQSDEKVKLEEQSAALVSQIETQKELIKNLNQTYSDASRSENINEVFDKNEINETVKFLPDGRHLVSIQGERGRVHQFVIPENSINLSHDYYHKVVKSLNSVIDEEDLPHEYQREMAKFIRVDPPQYNCLT